MDRFAKTYIERGPQASGKASWKDDDYLLMTVRNHRTASGQRLGDTALTSITEDELEAFHAAQRAAGRAASTLNHFVQVLKAAFRWAVRKGYLTRSPISDGSALKRSKMAKRTRRLTPEEESALLSTSPPRLQRLIVGALETGARLGELLDLTWRDVALADGGGVITVRGETAKDAEPRLIPISSRLAAFLELAKTDPAGRDYTPKKFVFGELGERVASIKRAWETALLKAHGHTPVWVAGKLSPECRAASSDRSALPRSSAGSGFPLARRRLHPARGARPPRARQCQSDRHVLERENRRIAGVDEAVRCRAWQNCGKNPVDRPPASQPREHQGGAQRTVTLALAAMCARSSAG